MGKILGMKFQNVFRIPHSDVGPEHPSNVLLWSPHTELDDGVSWSSLFEKGKNPPPRILDVKLYFIRSSGVVLLLKVGQACLFSPSAESQPLVRESPTTQPAHAFTSLSMWELSH